MLTTLFQNTNVFQRIGLLSRSYTYWLMYVMVGLIALAVAMYHQHYLQELPCVVCIQMRLWFSLLIIVSIAGLYLKNYSITRRLTNLSIVLIAVGMIERSYLLLGTERGFIFSDCGFSLGLPSWFAIEDWLPWLFRIETSCGYTPEVLFGITMAETLMVSSLLIFLTSFCLFIADFVYTRSQLK